jgi:ferritin-like metal-binding protein YciE
MSTRTLQQQLIKYLADAHSIELQALAQLERAPEIAGDESLGEVFRVHLLQTREHERLVREQLQRRGGDTSALKDLAGKVGGWAMIAFAKLNPDTPGKLVAHAYSYEHMELAAYELLGLVAERAGDEELVATARQIGEQEKAMASRLADCFDAALDASLREKQARDPRAELVSYLQDARAIEAQSLQLLEAAPAIVGCEPLADAFRAHREQTQQHASMLEERLRELRCRPQRLQDTALRIGGLSIGAFMRLQPDTAVKLAGFAFAFEHLEIAAYELLRRVAARAHEERSAQTAEQILEQERAAAGRIAESFDEAVDAALAAVGVRAAA